MSQENALLLPGWMTQSQIAELIPGARVQLSRTTADFGVEDLERDVPVWLLEWGIEDEGEEDVLKETLLRNLGYLGRKYDLQTALCNSAPVHAILPHASVERVLEGTMDELANWVVTNRDAHNSYDAILHRLASLYGVPFCLYPNEEGDVVYPESTESTINLYVNVRPPGEGGHERRKRVFGFEIGSGQPEGWVCVTPALGVGTVVYDRDIPVVQVLGNSAYLLVPLFASYNEWTSDSIFWRLMKAVFDGLRAEKERQQTAAPPSPSLMAKEISSWTLSWEREMWILCSESAQRIDELRSALTREMRRFADFQLLLKSVRKDIPSDETITELLCKDVERMQAMEIAQVWLAEKGVHVLTKDVIITHNGRRYLIGPLLIRISSRATVRIWSDQPLGPKKKPHPHVDGYEIPCFGNASLRITTLLSQHRYADALETILAWLVLGYSAETTLDPIEGWPEIAPNGEVVPPTPVETLEISGISHFPLEVSHE